MNLIIASNADSASINLRDRFLKCPDCEGDFQRLLCFQDGLSVKPPPIPFEFSDNHEGWKYWLDFVRNY